MSNAAKWAIVAAGFLSAIFLAGFFHAEDAPSPLSRRESCEAVAKRPMTLASPPACELPAPAAMPEFRDRAGSSMATSVPAPTRGLLAMTNSPSYKRAGDLSLRVEDCTRAEDALEAKLVAIKGEIVEMVMEGTEGSRTCTLSAVIPADQFRGFITDLRKMGKVQSERITASKLRPGTAEGAAAGGAPDPRELSLVSIRMADEKVAQNVLESRGVLATSFDRSASHLLKGLAVLVELVGMLLPFAIALAVIAVPVLVVLKLRRARPSGI